MVKRLIISSDNSADDKKAAMMVSKAMLEKEVEGVVWYSSMANALSLIEPTCNKVIEQDKVLVDLLDTSKSLVDGFNKLAELLCKYIEKVQISQRNS